MVSPTPLNAAPQILTLTPQGLTPLIGAAPGASQPTGASPVHTRGPAAPALDALPSNPVLGAIMPLLSQLLGGLNLPGINLNSILGNLAQGKTPTSASGSASYGPTGPGSTPLPLPGGAAASVKLSREDALNYIMAASRGGTIQANEVVEGSYADPRSRFYNAGQNEFDAAVAQLYAAQFKGFARGLDILYQPQNRDNAQQIAENIYRSQFIQMKPEAEMLSRVAAVYRGDFSGVHKYDNAALAQVAQEWVRRGWANPALLNDPSLGKSDVESIGTAVKALDEQPDPAIRQQMLGLIFDFENNTAAADNGLPKPVPAESTRAYQYAVAVVQDGTLDRVLNNYVQGIKTDTPVLPQNPLPQPTRGWLDLLNPERSALGLNDKERGILHVVGREIIRNGHQTGGKVLTVLQDSGLSLADVQREMIQISRKYANLGLIAKPLTEQDLARAGIPQVMNDPSTHGTGETFKPKREEVHLALEWATRDILVDGVITGRHMDKDFFTLYQKLTGVDLSQRYAGYDYRANRATTATRFPTAAIDSAAWNADMKSKSGFNDLEHLLFRLWGHSGLFNGGKIDAQYTAWALRSGLDLDNGADKQLMAETLAADLVANGQLDGDTLSHEFLKVLDKAYLGAPGTDVAKMRADASVAATGRPDRFQQVFNQLKPGFTQAIAHAASFIENHPILTGIGAGGIAAAVAVCPYLASLGAASAGLLAGQALQQQKAA